MLECKLYIDDLKKQHKNTSQFDKVHKQLLICVWTIFCYEEV